jgi:hypothetical protein
MKHIPLSPRLAIAALSAAVLIPIAPVFGQDAAAPPPVVTISPPPPVVTPPPPVSVAPPAVRPAPPPITRAAPPPQIDEPVARSTRAAPRTRAAAPVRRAAPAPAPAPVAQAPAVAPAPAPAPVAEIPVAEAPPVVETAPIPVETPVESGRNGALGLALAGLAILVAGLAFFFWRRRRASADQYEEAYYEEPVTAAPEPGFTRPAPEPIAAAAAAAAPAIVEEASVEDANQADVDALAADSAPVAGRPWLEFLLRPVRAGTSQDDTIVQFELTIGNTGTVAATDVKISTWMFAAGQSTDMERMLIEPPADATVSEVDIAAGDGARVDAEIALPKGSGEEAVLPVVVADARYRLPDGSEGRTRASFEIGLPDGDHLAPFPVDRASGLMENVEARLHGVPERV